jgi:hypothetical protein
MGSNRQSKIDKIKKFVLQQNTYLEKYPKSKAEGALRNANSNINHLKMKSIIKAKLI